MLLISGSGSICAISRFQLRSKMRSIRDAVKQRFIDHIKRRSDDTVSSNNVPSVELEPAMMDGRYRVVEQVHRKRFIAIDSDNAELVRIDLKPRPYRNKSRFDSHGLKQISKFYSWKNEKFAVNNVVRLLRVFNHDAEHFGFVYEHYPETWASMIADSAGRCQIPLEMVQRMTFDVLKALESIHQYQILHVNIRPETIQYDRISGKSYFFNFGFELSFYTMPTNLAILHGDIQYQAPELLLRPQMTGPFADLWSLGATLFKIVTGESLALSLGTSFKDKVQNVLFQLIQRFSHDQEAVKNVFLKNASKSALVEDSFTSALEQAGRRYLSECISDPRETEILFDKLIAFISKCLVWKPRDRMIPFTALKHPFVHAIVA